MKQLFLYLYFAIIVPFTVGGQTVYVKQGGTGNGTSWATASGNLAGVLQSATVGTKVWVAEGVYYPTSCTNCTLADRDKSFELKEGVQLIGGFVGTETTLEQRDFLLHPTVLSGDINRNIDTSFNSFTVLFVFGTSSATITDGIIVQDGYASQSLAGNGSRRASGGGVYIGTPIGTSTAPIFRNCIFRNNFAAKGGGGMYMDGSFNSQCNPLFESCRWESNISISDGGGVELNGSFSGEVRPVFTDCVFSQNQCRGIVGNGGGMAIVVSEFGFSGAQLTNCNFNGNQSPTGGGGLYVFAKNGSAANQLNNVNFNSNTASEGGGFMDDASYGGITEHVLVNCTFQNNTALIDGGAVFHITYEQGQSYSTFNTCNFLGNHSISAGAAVLNNAFLGTCNPVFYRCRFQNNSADTYGGAIYNLGKQGDASPLISNCVFARNTANSAGAVYCLGSEHGKSSPKITNCTFYKNTANVGGAIYSNGGDTTGTARPVVTNCILYGNQANFGSEFRNIYGFPQLSYSIVDTTNCFNLNSGMGGLVECGPGIIFNQAPLFVDASSNNFRLLPNSPAINVGSNTAIDTTYGAFDFGGNTRVVNGTVDLGAWEFPTPTSQAPTIISQAGGGTFCESELVQLEVTAVGTGTLQYQWYKSGVIVADATSSILLFSSIGLSEGGSFICTVANSAGMASSTIFTISVLPKITPSVNITAPMTPICEGTSFEVQTTVTGGGTMPLISWQQNGQPLSQNGSTVMVVLQNGLSIQATVLSNATCVTSNMATSNVLTFSAQGVVTPSIAITASMDTLCIGSELDFTAVADNVSPNANYEWRVNGQARATGAEWTTGALQNGDVVTCQVEALLGCVTAPTALSNEIMVIADSCIVNTLDVDVLEMKVGPNPFLNYIQVEMPLHEGPSSFEIFSINGLCFGKYNFKKGERKMMVATQHLPKGMYICVATKSKQKQAFRLIKS